MWGNRSAATPLAANALKVGAYGKTPFGADFLFSGPIDPDVQAFRAWLEDAVGWASVHQPQLWPTALHDNRVFGFVFRGPSGNMLVGALKPSVDAVGRHFPISVYVSAASSTLHDKPQILPLSFGDVLQYAADAVLTAHVQQAVLGLEVALNQGSVVLSNVDTDASEYAAWRETTPLVTAFDAISGASGRGSAAQILHTICEAIGPFRGQETPKTPLSVRVPLGGSGAGAAAFWIDVVRHAAGWRRTVPSVFWSFQGGSGEALVQLGDVHPSSLSELWLPDPESAVVCDLTRVSTTDSARFLPLLRPAVAAALTRPDARVIDLMTALQS